MRQPAKIGDRQAKQPLKRLASFWRKAPKEVKFAARRAQDEFP